MDWIKSKEQKEHRGENVICAFTVMFPLEFHNQWGPNYCIFCRKCRILRKVHPSAVTKLLISSSIFCWCRAALSPHSSGSQTEAWTVKLLWVRKQSRAAFACGPAYYSNKPAYAAKWMCAGCVVSKALSICSAWQRHVSIFLVLTGRGWFLVWFRENWGSSVKTLPLRIWDS